MRVGIDVTALLYGRGVSRYTSNLVRSLLSYTPTELSLYGSSLRGKHQLEHEIKALLKSVPRLAHPPSVTLQSYPPSVQHVLWNVLHQNKILKAMPKIEVFHSWDWLQPPDTHLPLISTIHDLAILKFPETAHPNIVKMHRLAWKRLKDAQAHVIAISRSTRQDVIELLQFDPKRVHVVHEALPQEFISLSQKVTEERQLALKEKLKLERPFILFVGTREPRKNIARLIDAWLPLAKDYELVIAGLSGWDESDKQARQVNNPHLRFLGRVTDEELAVLYSEAEVFAYPSLYEGFGLPILEAFHYGTPVLTSQDSSMVEVAGNAAQLVDPQSVESIQDGLQHLLNEPVADQQRRLQKMIIRLQMFDWQRVAQETAAIYRIARDEKQ